ncbi:MAG TPA: TrmH family RNA methyltransferase [Sphaerochaeta sp.]|nr:TrmH family RNA methyltransferase [Sphaerochaeta sp.]
MITLRKLATFSESSRLAKCVRLFYQCAQSGCNPIYLRDLIALTETTADSHLGAAPRPYLGRARSLIEAGDPEQLKVALLDAHYQLLAELGESVADWDQLSDDGMLDSSARTIYERYLILDRIRSPFNVGSIFRSADSFGIAKIFLVAGSASPLHRRSKRTALGTVESVDWEVLEEAALLHRLAELDLPIFALESGGEEVGSFAFPERGVAVVGGEELGITDPFLRAAAASLGRVSIALGGSKGSLNVSVATAIMLQRWYSA